MFHAELYQNRRRRLAQSLANQGLILLLGNGESSFNYTDNTYPFRQDSSFLYFCGIDRPDMALVIDTASGQSTLYADDLSLDYQVWMGVQPATAEWAHKAGVEKWAPYDQLAADLAKAGQILYLPPYRAENQVKLAAFTGREYAAVPAGVSEALIRQVVALRARKDAFEIEEMERAVDTSVRMHRLARQLCRPGATEQEIAGAVEGMAIAEGGRLSYQAIISINGHILHNHHYDNTLQEGQLLLIDAGAETARRYAGDLTRTFPVADKLTTAQRDIYNIVLQSQVEAINSLKPGIPYRDVHLQAALTIAKGLTELDLMQGDPQEAAAAGAHALFFPHGLGHMIGLDVHDMEDLGENYVGYSEAYARSTQFGLRSLRLARPLEPGFVLTVEPGIYFIPILIDRWKAEAMHKDFIRYDRLDAWRSFGGIRIEDNVHITESGHKVLGDPLIKTADEIMR